MTKKRSYGDGGIDQRSEDNFRLRYRIGKERYSITFHGTPKEAKEKLRELLRSADDGNHVDPTRMTLGEWMEHWLSIGAPGQKKIRAGRRSVERYQQLLRGHVIPALSAKRLQQIHATDIDRLYEGLECKLAPQTQHQVHVVFGACLSAAVRKGLLSVSPIERAEKIPSPGESDHGQVLDKDQLGSLVQSFRGSTIYSIVAIAAFTGARRNEILALRWCDLDPVAKTLRIERSLEETGATVRGQAQTQRFKEPKRASHTRTITIDADLVALLLSEREKCLRIIAGVPAGTTVDLSLVKLPADALMFPSPTGLDFTRAEPPSWLLANLKIMPASNTPASASTICAAVTKLPCLMLACRSMSLPTDADTIRRRC